MTPHGPWNRHPGEPAHEVADGSAGDRAARARRGFAKVEDMTRVDLRDRWLIALQAAASAIASASQTNILSSAEAAGRLRRLTAEREDLLRPSSA